MMQHSAIALQESHYLAVLVTHGIHDWAAIVSAVTCITYLQLPVMVPVIKLQLDSSGPRP